MTGTCTGQWMNAIISAWMDKGLGCRKGVAEVPEAVLNVGIFWQSIRHFQSGLERLYSLKAEGCCICK